MSDHVFDCRDGEPVECFDEREVIARKAHVCLECAHAIVPGETYVRASYLYGGWVTEKRCRCCHGMRCRIGELYDGQTCIVSGELWNAVDDAIREGLITREEIDQPVVTYIAGTKPFPEE